MYGLLLTLLVLDGIVLILVVLLQSGKGGGLAAMGGGVTAGEGVLGGRQATTFLTRATWASGGMFMALALVLSILSSRAQAPSSILEGQIQAPTLPTPILPEGGSTAPAPAPGPAETGGPPALP